MKQHFFLFVCCLSIVGIFGDACAERNTGYFETNSGGEHSRPRKDGFFFYKDPAEVPIAEEQPEDTLPPTQEKIQPDTPELQPPAFDGTIHWETIYAMPTKEFSVLIDNVMDWAIENPTHERVETYVTLQAVAIERAERFQKAWGQVLNSTPVLDPTTQRPPTAIGTKMAVLERNADISQYIVEMRDNLGILIFTRPGCSYCAEQKKIMDSFQRYWLWDHVQYVDISERPDLAEEYGVNIVPDIFVVGNVGQEVLQRRLQTGLTSRTELERGMLEAYSMWFHDRVYTPALVLEGQKGFAEHIAQKAAQSAYGAKQESKKEPESALESLARKHQKKR